MKEPSAIIAWAVIVKATRTRWIHWATIETTKKRCLERYLELLGVTVMSSDIKAKFRSRRLSIEKVLVSPFCPNAPRISSTLLHPDHS